MCLYVRLVYIVSTAPTSDAHTQSRDARGERVTSRLHNREPVEEVHASALRGVLGGRHPEERGGGAERERRWRPLQLTPQVTAHPPIPALHVLVAPKTVCRSAGLLDIARIIHTHGRLQGGLGAVCMPCPPAALTPHALARCRPNTNTTTSIFKGCVTQLKGSDGKPLTIKVPGHVPHVLHSIGLARFALGDLRSAHQS